MEKIDLVMVTPELRTFKSKVGGLGDVAEELPKTIAEMGIKTTIVSPLYQHVRGEIFFTNGMIRAVKRPEYKGLSIEDTKKEIEIDIGNEKIKVKIKKSKIGKADVILLEQEKYADIVYGGDLLKQAILIGRGTIEMLKVLQIKPTIIHLHDALTSLVSLLRIDKKYIDDPFFNNIKLVYTVHNAGMAYQQIFDSNRYDELGIERAHWNEIVWNGKINLTYVGLLHSDICTTVSKDYASTIKNDGEGLGPIFRKKDIVGITNGIAINYWKVKEAKKTAKKILIERIKEKTGASLDENKFTIVMPRRLAYQKGINILIDIIHEVVKERSEGGVGAQVILMGMAHENDSLGKEWERKLKELAEKLKNKFVFLNLIDYSLAKLMYKGGDLLFYPSLPDKEPCGTGYMNAMVNMTPSLCTNTGGVVEIIEEFNPETGKGNGFKVEKNNYSSQAFLEKLKIISDIFYNRPETWQKLLKNTSKVNVSIERVAKEYITRIYLPVLKM